MRTEAVRRVDGGLESARMTGLSTMRTVDSAYRFIGAAQSYWW